MKVTVGDRVKYIGWSEYGQYTTEGLVLAEEENKLFNGHRASRYTLTNERTGEPDHVSEFEIIAIIT